MHGGFTHTNKNERSGDGSAGQSAYRASLTDTASPQHSLSEMLGRDERMHRQKEREPFKTVLMTAVRDCTSKGSEHQLLKVVL